MVPYAHQPAKAGVSLIDRGSGKLRWYVDGKDIGKNSKCMVPHAPDGGMIRSGRKFYSAVVELT